MDGVVDPYGGMILGGMGMAWILFILKTLWALLRGMEIKGGMEWDGVFLVVSCA